MVISTRLGGMVSDMAPDAESRAMRSPSLLPLFFISGKRAGATAAMSAALDPEMPETRYIAPSRPYCKPPRTWPSSDDKNSIIARASPVISIRAPRKTKSGTDSRMSEDMPSSMRPATMDIGVLVASAR